MDMTNTEIVVKHVAAFGQAASRASYLDLYADDAQLYGYAGVGPGKEGIRQFYEAMWTSFPDACVDIQETMESGDRVIVRFEFAGTHQGEFLGVAPTGRSVRVHGITILRMANGKCAERWSAADFLTALMQIGAFPAPR